MSVVKSKRSIPNTQVILDADALLRHTLLVTSNEKIFKPCYKGLTNKINDLALNIYINCLEALNISLKRSKLSPTERYSREHILRLQYQEEAIRNCKALLMILNIAYSVFHLRGHKVDYWASLVITARTSIIKWKKNSIEKCQKDKNIGSNSVIG